MEWISVEERLPIEKGKYIVCVRNLTGYRPLEEEVLVAHFGWGDWDFDGWEDNRVTHWMPFPKKPN